MLCWGANTTGQLSGDGTADNDPHATPTVVPGVPQVSDLALLGEAVLARGADGKWWSWGWNAMGQAAQSISTAAKVGPSKLLGQFRPDSPGTETAHDCALDAGKLVCWGINNEGQLAKPPGAPSEIPSSVAIPGEGAVDDVSVGAAGTCAVAGGSVYCWGSNEAGQLGTMAGGGSSVPTKVSLPSAAARVAKGYLHACALLVDNRVFCWGGNDWGQLGDGTTLSRPTPKEVSW